MSQEVLKIDIPTEGFSALLNIVNEIEKSLQIIVSSIKEISQSLNSVDPSNKINVEDFAGVASAAISLVGIAVAYALGVGEIATLVAAAIALIAAEIDFVITHWDEIKQSFSNLWEAIGPGVQEACEWISSIFNDMVQWINENIIIPIGDFFSDLWEGIKDAFQSGIDFIVGIFSPIVTWIDENIVTPIVSVFSWAWENISNAVSEFVGIVSDIFTSLVNIVKIYVIEPVSNFFADMWEKIKSFFQSGIDFIVDLFTTIVSWIKEKIITPISSFFSDLWDGIKSGVSSAVDFITNIFNTVVSFIQDKIITPIADFFDGLWNGIKNGIKSMANGAIDVLNGLIKGVLAPINLLIDGLNKIPGVNIRRLEFQITPISFASGGFPSMGQMFIAREAGPELVGTIGGRNAVMNNNQIVESVSSGVYRAVKSAMKSGGESVIQVFIGNEQLDEYIVSSRQRRMLQTNGVYA